MTLITNPRFILDTKISLCQNSFSTTSIEQAVLTTGIDFLLFSLKSLSFKLKPSQVPSVQLIHYKNPILTYIMFN